MAGDWEQCVERLVKKLLNVAAVWFSYVGEGRRPKRDANNPCTWGDARSLDDRLDVSTCIAGLGPPEETLGALCQWDTPVPMRVRLTGQNDQNRLYFFIENCGDYAIKEICRITSLSNTFVTCTASACQNHYVWQLFCCTYMRSQIGGVDLILRLCL